MDVGGAGRLCEHPQELIGRLVVDLNILRAELDALFVCLKNGGVVNEQEFQSILCTGPDRQSRTVFATSGGIEAEPFVAKSAKNSLSSVVPNVPRTGTVAPCISDQRTSNSNVSGPSEPASLGAAAVAPDVVAPTKPSQQPSDHDTRDMMLSVAAALLSKRPAAQGDVVGIGRPRCKATVPTPTVAMASAKPCSTSKQENSSSGVEDGVEPKTRHLETGVAHDELDTPGNDVGQHCEFESTREDSDEHARPELLWEDFGELQCAVSEKPSATEEGEKNRKIKPSIESAIKDFSAASSNKDASVPSATPKLYQQLKADLVANGVLPSSPTSGCTTKSSRDTGHSEVVFRTLPRAVGAPSPVDLGVISGEAGRRSGGFGLGSGRGISGNVCKKRPVTVLTCHVPLEATAPVERRLVDRFDEECAQVSVQERGGHDLESRKQAVYQASFNAILRGLGSVD